MSFITDSNGVKRFSGTITGDAGAALDANAATLSALATTVASGGALPRICYASQHGCVADCIVATGAKIGGGTPTDNATALNAILAQATASNPIELVLDGGYAIGTSLRIPAIGNVTIRGLGWGTGLFVLPGSNTNAISSAIFGTTDLSYQTVWGLTAQIGPDGITGQTGANVVIRDLIINGNRAIYPNGNCNGTRDGTITGNASPAADARGPYPALYWLLGIALAQLDNVLIDNVHCYDIPAYSVSLYACRYVKVVNCRFESPKVAGVRGTNTDGVHINGGCSDVTVDHCTLQTGDDGVAFNLEEGNQVAGSQFKATNLTFDDCASGVRVYGSQVTQTQQVIISGCTGTMIQNWFLVLGVGAGSTVTGLNHSVSLSDIEVQFTNSAAFGLVGVAAFTGSLVLDNVRIIDPLYPIPMVKCTGAPTLTDLTIHNCHIQRTQSGNAAAFFLLADSGTIHNLTLSDSTLTQEVGYTYTDVNYAIDLYAGGGTATVTNIDISDCVIDGAFHTLITLHSANVTVSGLTHTSRSSGTACLNLFSGTFNLTAANVVLNGVATLYTNNSGTVTIVGWTAGNSLTLSGNLTVGGLLSSAALPGQYTSQYSSGEDWVIGGNAGSGAGVNTFGIFSPTFGAGVGHGYYPIWQVANDGSMTCCQGGGAFKLPALPTSDPHVVGQLWNSSGTVKVSAG